MMSIHEKKGFSLYRFKWYYNLLSMGPKPSDTIFQIQRVSNKVQERIE